MKKKVSNTPEVEGVEEEVDVDVELPITVKKTNPEFSQVIQNRLKQHHIGKLAIAIVKKSLPGIVKLVDELQLEDKEELNLDYEIDFDAFEEDLEWLDKWHNGQIKELERRGKEGIQSQSQKQIQKSVDTKTSKDKNKNRSVKK